MTSPVVRRDTCSALDFIYWIQKQIGDKFVTGIQVSLEAPNPVAFDGAELVRWSAAQVGVFMPIGPDSQIAYCAAKGTEILVADAIRVRGAILWNTGRIGISLGGSRIIEEVTGRVGIVKGGADKRYIRAGKIPGLIY